MEINITWNICRVCLLEEPKGQTPTSGNEQQMRHIFDDDKLLAKQIYECSGIMVCFLQYMCFNKDGTMSASMFLFKAALSSHSVTFRLLWHALISVPIVKTFIYFSLELNGHIYFLDETQ